MFLRSIKFLFFAVLVLYATSTHAGTNTNTIDQAIRAALTGNLKLRDFGPVSMTRKNGLFGRDVTYTYYFIYIRDSSNFYVNEQADAYLYLLPLSYANPTEIIKKEFENAYVTDTAEYKVYLLTTKNEKDVELWDVLRKNLRRNLSRLLSETNSVGELPKDDERATQRRTR